MAVVTKKSGPVTARDAASKINANVVGNFSREGVGTVELVSGDSIGSKLVMFPIQSCARVSQILLYCDKVGTATAADIGLYQETSAGGAVVDADFFAAAQSLGAAALQGADVTHKSGAFDIDETEKMIWECLGLAEDPGVIYDVVLTLTAAADGAGTVSVKGRYAY